MRYFMLHDADRFRSRIAPALATDHRVIRVDLIGHGGTAAPAAGYTIPRQAELVAAVLDRLGVDRVTVIGHSMGGEVATALAERNPARIAAMILIDSPPTAPAVREPLPDLASSITEIDQLAEQLLGAGEAARKIVVLGSGQGESSAG